MNLANDFEAVVGTSLVRDSWVENRRSWYVVEKGITEMERLKDGLTNLKGSDGAEGGFVGPQ